MLSKNLVGKQFAAMLILLLLTEYAFAQQTIASAKTLPSGSVVTVEGFVTTGAEYGTIRYMQDNTAGIAVYSTSLSTTMPGDRIEVTGVLSTFNGQIQISPVIEMEILSTGHELVPPTRVVLDDPSLRAFESMVVFIPCLGISTCEPDFEQGWYTSFDDQGQSIKLYIEENNPSIGNAIPAEPIIASGILVFQNESFHFLAQYFSPATDPDCYVIDRAVIVPNTQSQTSLFWHVDGPGNFRVEYGMDEYNHQDNVAVSNESITYDFNDLQEGQIYRVRLRQVIEDDTIYSFPVLMTAGKIEEPQIEIYFNRNVNTSFSDGSHPAATGPTVIESDVLERISQVESTLDIAMYNTNDHDIVQAVKDAAGRGVAVRYIADEETSNNALQGSLPFDVLFRSGEGIMHHKFMIADVDIPQKAWIWSGSTNFSSNQLSSDPNHAYVFHDQAIARNYKIEFDELWGADPTHTLSHAGEYKTDNTAHQFEFGETRIESYFSPSDETNCHIIETLRTADHHIQSGLLLLTKENIVNELIALHEEGVHIRVIVEDEESSSYALMRLRQAGIEIRIHDLSPIFHHKYAIIDEGYSDSDPVVISGSHNWTWSADNINDENTLIIHDQSAANIFRQEFEARWSELQNTTSEDEIFPHEMMVMPNPASDYVRLKNQTSSPLHFTLYDATGRPQLSSSVEANTSFDLNAHDLNSGLYLIQWHRNESRTFTKFVIQH